MSTDETVNQTGTAAKSPPATTDEAKQSGSGLATSLEFTKVILDFLSKCFYPAIIIAILYLIWPTLASLDLNSLLGRLQSAKAGGYEFTFGQAQDVGAEIAPLNSKIADLERALTSVSSDLRNLQKVSGVPKLSPEQAKALEAKEKTIKANADYTVLVFHRAASRERAAKITGALLSQGFKSSDTETNYAELQKVKPEDNVIFLTYTPKGEEILTDLEKSIAALAPGAEVRRNPRPINLKRGDVQILVF